MQEACGDGKVRPIKATGTWVWGFTLGSSGMEKPSPPRAHPTALPFFITQAQDQAGGRTKPEALTILSSLSFPFWSQEKKPALREKGWQGAGLILRASLGPGGVCTADE